MKHGTHVKLPKVGDRVWAACTCNACLDHSSTTIVTTVSRLKSVWVVEGYNFRPLDVRNLRAPTLAEALLHDDAPIYLPEVNHDIP